MNNATTLRNLTDEELLRYLRDSTDPAIQELIRRYSELLDANED